MEWIETVFEHGALRTRREVGALEDRSGLRADLLHCHVVHLRIHRVRFGLCDGPFGSESTFSVRECQETFDVVTVPEKELKVFGGVLDVDEVVHEISGGTWLDRYDVSTTLPERSSSVRCSQYFQYRQLASAGIAVLKVAQELSEPNGTSEGLCVARNIDEYKREHAKV